MKLYELTNDMQTVLDKLQAVMDWQPDINLVGQPIDEQGNVIENVEAYKDELVTMWCDTYDGLEGEFKDKAESTALYLINLDSDLIKVEAELKRLKAKVDRIKKSKEFLKAYLMGEIDALGISKVETPLVKLTVRNNAESVEILDENAVIEWAEETEHDEVLKYKKPEISKTALKKLIADGAGVPSARLVRTKSLIIK